MKKDVQAASPVSLVDLLPTLGELCGVPVPDNVQGQSLVPMLKDPSKEGRGWALTQVARGAGNWGRASARSDVGSEGKMFFGYSLRTARWRYTEWDEGRKGRELYDHDNDPKEINNLAEKQEHQGTVATLSGQLQSAVASSLPKSGKMPEVKSGLWAPQYIE